MEENQIVLEQVVTVTEFSGTIQDECRSAGRENVSPKLRVLWRAILLAGAMFALASCT